MFYSIREFYENLYTAKTREVPLEQTMLNLDISGLNEVPERVMDSLRGELSIEELSRAVRTAKNNESGSRWLPR